jgi:hypothetical protein
VDNSALGKEANMSGKPAYCIHVYKQGYRKKHMPHASLGDKVSPRSLFYYICSRFWLQSVVRCEKQVSEDGSDWKNNK